MAPRLELDYFQKIPALSAGVNWLFGAHPDLYLVGALTEAYLFAPEKAALAPAWKARCDEIFDEFERLNNRSRAASAAGVRVMGQTQVSVSRAQRSMKRSGMMRCRPGTFRTRHGFVAWRSRISGAPLRAAPHPGHVPSSRLAR